MGYTGYTNPHESALAESQVLSILSDIVNLFKLC